MSILDRLEALREAATPGPWKTADGEIVYTGEWPDPQMYVEATTDDIAETEATTELIALMHASVPGLVRVARAAEPMARLPYPVSADERTDWLTYQQKLVDALASLVDAGSDVSPAMNPCSCGHDHIAGDDGEDCGCRTCECPTWHDNAGHDLDGVHFDGEAWRAICQCGWECWGRTAEAIARTDHETHSHLSGDAPGA